MDRINRHPELSMLERTQLDEVLDAAAVATLATVVDGGPWAVPMLYARDGDRILLHGSTGAGALRQVAAGAPASLCVVMLDGIVLADNFFDSAANYRSAVVRGRLTGLTPDESARALTTLSDALIPGRSTEVCTNTKKELAATLTIALSITAGHWTGKVRDAPPNGPSGDGGEWAGVVPLRTVAGPPVPAHWVGEDVEAPPSVRRLVERRSRADRETDELVS